MSIVAVLPKLGATYAPHTPGFASEINPRSSPRVIYSAVVITAFGSKFGGSNISQILDNMEGCGIDIKMAWHFEV